MTDFAVQGNLRPEEALQSLTIYEGKFGRLKDDREKCAKAKEALELTDTGLLSGSEERVQVHLVCTDPAIVMEDVLGLSIKPYMSLVILICRWLWKSFRT